MKLSLYLFINQHVTRNFIYLTGQQCFGIIILRRNTIYKKEVLAFMSISQNRIPYFYLRDQDEVYKELTERLIHELTLPFCCDNKDYQQA